MNLKKEAMFFGVTSIIIGSTLCMNVLAYVSPMTTCTPRKMGSSLFANKKSKVTIDLSQMPEKGSGNILEKVFTGGSFEDDAASTIEKASKIASRIKSTKDLGWTQPPKRSGSARPRHRAWGGEKELPIQSKPNYDETRENCVEKWLTIEDFSALTKSSGPEADTVFVAFAGGAKYAEREFCEEVIAQWRSGEGNNRSRGAGVFNEAAFEKSVKNGRASLFTGWATFLSISTFFATCIILPTNPAAKYFESLIGKLLSVE